MNLEKTTNMDKKLNKKTIFNKFLHSFSINSKFLIIFIILIISVIFSISIWIKPNKYSVLYNHLSNKDGESIVSELMKMHIPYKFDENSGMLLVPNNTLHKIRFYLSKYNLPKGPGIGFELLDKEKFGISQFNEQVNYQRALEGELARTIERLDLINSARIHIALPKSSLFIREKKEPTASIILDLKPGCHLDRRQINAILRFISSSISGLTPDHITIVDQSGNLLNRLEFFNNEVNEMQIRYIEEIEKRYKKRIKAILSPFLGSKNVHAQVTAQIDFNNQEKTEEKFKPNFDTTNQAIRSHQRTLNVDFSGKNSDLLIPDSSLNKSSNISKININNTEGLDSRKTLDMNLDNQNKLDKTSYFYKNSKNYHDEIINYELDHSVLRTKINIGEIKRLSTAVVVNFIKNKQGKYIPIPINLMKKIDNLTRQVVGFSKARGDTINVVNSLFVSNSDISKSSDSTKFYTDQYHIVKKIDKKDISNLYVRDFKIKQYFMWKDLIQSNILLRFSPFVILFLLLFVLLQYFFYRKKISRYKFLCTNNINEKEKKINSQIVKDNKNYLIDTTDVTNISDVKDISGDISKDNLHIIKMIIREWMSDKKL